MATSMLHPATALIQPIRNQPRASWVPVSVQTWSVKPSRQQETTRTADSLARESWVCRGLTKGWAMYRYSK
jgi:hypothetical protein